LLHWEQVSQFIGATKIASSEIKEYLQDFYTDKTHWYALRVKSDAMTTSGNNKSFHENDMIIIDPEKNATHGNYIIALLPRAKEATFKQYVVDGGIKYLKPLNPQYPITQIDTSTHICGVVVGCFCLA
jgi:SOS-response transcriptional repressor LexA